MLTKHTQMDRRLARLVLWLVYISCPSLILADFVVHKHPHFAIENLTGFYALIGFVAFITIVWIGVQLRKLVSREENYYDKKLGDV